MIISIINTTSLNRQEVQNKIRAVNRQLQEDFKAYWHTDVQLRLEGWTGETIDPSHPLNMRGNAVIYLWEDDDTTHALGYHALTNRGVPFGFVFPHLSELLREDWSVTLSHEALELALDAEVNRLVRGPHPDPTQEGRIVYHWYELCDAVQADTYSIDGVDVSNFVLPLYFTESEEHLNHNDFLGRGVRSFGVRPGGYVGFFDPEKGVDDQYHAPDDDWARHRMAAKATLVNTKRTDRRDPYASADILNDPRWVTCDAISFKLNAKHRRASSPLEAAQRIVSRHLGNAWRLRSCAGDPNEFDAIYTGKLPVSFASAWQLTHILEKESSVAYAEPSFTFPVPGETDAPDQGSHRRESSAGEEHDDATDALLWALKECNVLAAWELIEKSGKKPGEKVLIGHPDSGFVAHREMDIERVRIDFDKDFLEEDWETRTEEPEHGLHGLATASVMMSGQGGATDKIRGPAHYSEILPLRVTKPGLIFPAPVLFSGGMRRLRDAVDYAVRHGCQIISISLGGLEHRGLENAIHRAAESGVIVCAAAGNKVGFVVCPACYDDTIAVAGSRVDRGAWKGSCRGDTVDISAPAESVWRATLSDEGDRVVARSNGTSYATALVAGIAALWLSYHRDNLASRDPSEIPRLFRHQLKSTASTQHKLPSGFGAGIVDAAALLAQPLPAPGQYASTPRPPRSETRGLLTERTPSPDIPDGLQRELRCAEAILAMVNASHPATSSVPLPAPTVLGARTAHDCRTLSRLGWRSIICPEMVSLRIASTGLAQPSTRCPSSVDVLHPEHHRQLRAPIIFGTSRVTSSLLNPVVPPTTLQLNHHAVQLALGRTTKLYANTLRHSLGGCS